MEQPAPHGPAQVGALGVEAAEGVAGAAEPTRRASAHPTAVDPGKTWCLLTWYA